MKNFYITTTLPYVNAKPHIGFALEIIQADVLARFHRLLKKEVFFNTGTDEHGAKIYQKAQQENKNVQKYVDYYAQKFDNLKKSLSLSYNNFIRTTDPHHIQAAKKFWKRCRKNGDIYKSKQKIKYCIGCEMEKQDSELKQNRCPLHPNKRLETIEEENYFFRFSKYQNKLLKFYQQNPNFVIPENRFREIKNFVKSGLKDFSISRLKKKMPWGVEVPGDKNHVMYVWFDALINYISAIGWPDNQQEFEKWWPGIQIAGKDNLRQQTAIWQAMLMSANLPTSRRVLIHGFITSNGQKMSKSLGNVVNPFDLVEKYGTDSLRFYLLKEVPPFRDGDFTIKHFEEIYNGDLANGIGNLVQRLSKLAENSETKIRVKKFKIQDYSGYKKMLQQYQFNKTLSFIWEKISSLDRYIDKKQPWNKKGKLLKQIIQKGISQMLEIAFLLQPFLPETAEKIEKIFKQSEITAPETPLFPRI